MAISHQKLLIILLILFPIMTQASIPEAQALLEFKKSLVNSETALGSWAVGMDPCQAPGWAGVVCYEGFVLAVHIQFMGLSGRVDVDALSRLPGLRSIDLEGNRFTGPIPPLNRLGALKSIYLSSNQFSGEIPLDYFSRMGSLKKLWLSNNNFTGAIPLSLAQLPYLLELHLDNNQFSGPIPPLRQPPLMSLNLSNNHLDGEIPPSLSNFDASSFDGNSKLCGDVLGKSCLPNTPPPPPGTTTNTTGGREEPQSTYQPKKSNSNMLFAIAIVGAVMVVCFVIILFLLMKKQKDKNALTENSRTANPNPGEVKVEIGPTLGRKGSSKSSGRSSKRSSSSSSSRKSSRRGGSVQAQTQAQAQDDDASDLTLMNEEKGLFGMSDLMKASAEVLGNGAAGSVFKAMLDNGLVLAVKRMTEVSRFDTKEEFDGEMRKLANLRHENVLPPLAYHFRQGEKLVVYEYVPKGSLNYLLHGDRGSSHLELNWPRRLEIIKGVTRGLCYIHSQLDEYVLPHGNLKSSNILINSKNQPLLSDYGFNALVTPYVAAHSLFAYRSPEALELKIVTAKSDVFCLGVVILEILTGKFPSQYLASTKNGTDVVQWVASAMGEEREAELIDPEMMTKSTGSKQSMVKLLHIGAACTQPDPDTRPELGEIRDRIEKVEVEEGGGSSSSSSSSSSSGSNQDKHVKFILPESKAKDGFGAY